MRTAVSMFFFAVGLFMCLGAVGTIDIDRNANLPLQIGLAALGLFVMFVSTRYAKFPRKF